jgi:nitroreductase
VDTREAIRSRKSIRGFKPDPVSRRIIGEILEAACRAPSAMNTQPWEFVVLTGEVLETLRRKNLECLLSGVAPDPEHLVVSWPLDSVYRRRQVELARQLFVLMDIPRDDREKRAAWMARGFRYFDAPAAIIVLTDRRLSEAGPLLDVGAAIQNICLLALEYGLGTCIEDQGVMYPRVLRDTAAIPDSKRIVMALAIGYPDPDFPANRLESAREPAESLTRWIGFDEDPGPRL